MCRRLKQLGPVGFEQGDNMGDRAWVAEIAKELRDDMGDCPTLPAEMLELLRQLDTIPARVQPRAGAHLHPQGGSEPPTDDKPKALAAEVAPISR
jgi:hypothetical protein